MNRKLVILTIVAGVLALTYPIYAGFNMRNSRIDAGGTEGAEYLLLPEISTAPGTPDSGWGRLYLLNDGTLNVKNDAGTETDITAGAATAWDDLAAPDANEALDMTDYTTTWDFGDTDADMFNIQGTAAFGDVSVVRIEQITGNATDGTVLEVVAADANVDPLVVSASGKANALVVGQNTGVVTIAGVATGTDALVLTAGDITLTDGAMTLATGGLTLTHATGGDLSVGDDLTVTGDATITGTLSAGTIQESAIAPASGNLTIDAAGAGTIDFQSTSTGAATFKGDLDIGDAATDTLTITSIIDSNTTWDDGSTDSPHAIFKDSDDEQTEMYQDQSSDDFLVECNDASDSFAVTVGNLSAGEPSSDVITMNGDDLFVADDAEIDGTLAIDGDLDVNEDVSVVFDATDEEFVLTTSANVAGAGTPVVLFESSLADVTTQGWILELQYTDNADADADFFVCSDNNGGTDLFSINDGGTTIWTLDAAAYLQIDADTTASTTTAGVVDINWQTATNASEGIQMTVQLEDGATLAKGIEVDVDDDTTGAEVIDCFAAQNSAGTNATVNGFVGENTLDTFLDFTAGAASKAMILDATTTAHTGTAGVLDLAYRTATSTGHAVNLDVESDVAGGAGEVVSGFLVQLDDDANSADDELRAFDVRTDGDATGLQHAYYATGSGIDAALYAANGYVRVGTGSSEDQTLGDDDVFIEGHCEVDANLYVDGDQIIGDGSTEMVGVINDVVTDIDNETLTIAECGTIFDNSGDADGTIFTLPEASTAIGCCYTFVVIAAQNLNINPADATDRFIAPITDAQGDSIQSSTAGDSVTVCAQAADSWFIKAAYPAATDWPDAN